ncbi:unnamed protein product, partial [Rotaria sp. Silwood2]
MTLTQIGRFGLLITILLLFVYVIVLSITIKNNKEYVLSWTHLLRFNSYETNHTVNNLMISSMNSVNLPKILIVLGTRPG